MPGSRATSEAEAKKDRASARELSRAFRDAAARAVPSVVTIKTRTRDRDAKSGGGILDVVGESDANFDGFGSGVIIKEDGLILTNHHVVKDGKHIEVMLVDVDSLWLEMSSRIRRAIWLFCASMSMKSCPASKLVTLLN